MAAEYNTPFSAAPSAPELLAGSFENGDTSIATVESHPFHTAHTAPAFRADTDQSGEWYVWTRIGRSAGPTPARGGWATMQRCESRELAQRLADDLNQRALRVAV